jgi:hypothetical protein
MKSKKMKGARIGETRIAYRIFVGKPERKSHLVNHRHRWKDNIKMDLKDIEREVVDRIYLAQNRNQWQTVVNMVTHFRVL